MKPSDLDRMFDESYNRATNGRGALSGAFETSPLAADHLLLKRSWEYFRHRMKALDDHWKKILESKDVELNALAKELDLVRKKDQELHIENEAYRAFDVEYGKSKAVDYLTFQKELKNLKATWEEEREMFLKKEGEFSIQISELEATINQFREEFAQREKNWAREAEAAQSQMNVILEQQKKQHEQWASDMAHKEEETLNLNSKIDLLRPEIERRDQRIHELKEDLRKKDGENDELVQQVTALTKAIREQEEKYALLKERFEILDREKVAMHEAWTREQTEWRELWDRERELWDRKKTD
jgi:chromosome segregation ATPase